MIHVTCRLNAKNWDKLQNPTAGNRVSTDCTVRCHLAVHLIRHHLGPSTAIAIRASCVTLAVAVISVDNASLLQLEFVPSVL